MPRFFFHVCRPDARERDNEGIEFDSLEDAIADAQRAGLDMVAEAGREMAVSVFEIADEGGRVVATVPFVGDPPEASGDSAIGR